MKLTLIIPCYNEEDSLPLFHTAVQKIFQPLKISYELIYIDDGSSDKTFQIMKKMHKNDPNIVKIVQFTRNFGKEAAILAGLQYSKGAYIGIIDADLQQHPKYILKMMRILDRLPLVDVVCAYQKKRPNEGALAFVKNIFYKIMNHLAKVDLMENASDFRLFRRKVAKSILQLQEYHRFSKGIFAWLGYKTIYIPYVAEKRIAGRSKWDFRKLWNYAVEGIVGYSIRPLRIATVMGMVTATASMIYLSAVVLQKLIYGIPVPGYATIVVLMLLLGSMQLFCIGMIGEYTGRTFEQCKQRPVYVIKRTL